MLREPKEHPKREAAVDKMLDFGDKGLRAEKRELKREDHIHMLINATPKTSIPSLVKQIKGPSAREMFKQHPQIKEKLWGGHLWSPSYFVATTNENTSQQIPQYIQKQGQAK